MSLHDPAISRQSEVAGPWTGLSYLTEHPLNVVYYYGVIALFCASLTDELSASLWITTYTTHVGYSVSERQRLSPFRFDSHANEEAISTLEPLA
eukprot:scaffold41279_cov65-Cyclotella_meneghiniana.AAC.2